MPKCPSCNHVWGKEIPPNRYCHVCGREFRIRDNEEPSKFKRRQTCSHPCAVVLRACRRFPSRAAWDPRGGKAAADVLRKGAGLAPWSPL